MCHQLLDYVAMHPSATMQYMASDVILHVHLDASYLSKQNSKSCVRGHYYLTSSDDITPFNGAILTLLAIIKM